MESFEEILTAGGHSNSLGRAAEVLQIVQDDNSRVGELFDCVSADDAWVRMRAIDTFEKLIKDKPELVRLYLPDIFSTLTKSNQPSIQWHLAQIFTEVTLTEAQRADALTWLKSKISSTTVDWIVSVNVMRALLSFHKNGHVSSDELKPLFAIQADHTSKSVRKKAGIFLQELNGDK